jgi:hypothetical protein
VPPSERPIPRYAAEPPQEPLPYGRWADALAKHFLEACAQLETEEDLGEPVADRLSWFPDRTYGGRTYLPVTAPTSTGYELFGYVSYRREHEGAGAAAFEARADFTDETAEANPDWTLDLSDQELGTWRGSQGRRGEVALVFGQALVQGGALVTAELGPTTTDQCELVGNRFTLVSLDSYTGDYLEVKLWDQRGEELAAESLYEGDE